MDIEQAKKERSKNKIKKKQGRWKSKPRVACPMWILEGWAQAI